jgi:hypothetical protein
MNTMKWTGLSLLAAAAALAAVPGVAAVDTGVHVEIYKGIPPTGLWVVDCTNAFLAETNTLVGIEVYQITHEVLLDATSYVSDTGWFAGHEIGAAGAYVDCVTL